MNPMHRHLLSILTIFTLFVALPLSSLQAQETAFVYGDEFLCPDQCGQWFVEFPQDPNLSYHWSIYDGTSPDNGILWSEQEGIGLFTFDLCNGPINFVDFIPLVLGLLFIAVVIGVIWRASAVRKRKAMPPAPPPPPIPAHIIALEKLDQLEAAAAWKTGDIKGFQSDLTYTLREYLENRYELQALEATSPEIIKDLQRLKLDEQGTLRAVLNTADMVKFAKAIPAEAVHLQALTQVRDFVTATKYTSPVPVPDNEQLADVNAEEE